MRVATFNTLHGIALRDIPVLDPSKAARSGSKRDSPWSPDAHDVGPVRQTAKELAALGPIDVLALQEVDRHQERSGGVDQTEIFAKALNAQSWRFAASLHGTPGVATDGAAWVQASQSDDPPESQADPRRAKDIGPRYGVSLISRWPVRSWRVLRFPPAPVSLPLLAPSTGRPRAVRVPDEPRCAIAAIVELPHADVTVVCAHLTFVPGYNTKQLGSLRAFVAGMPRPLVLLGDLNLPGSIPGLLTGWQQVARVPTYPAQKPRVQFDHILADGWSESALSVASRSVSTHRMPLSDHCALLTDFPTP